MMKTSEEYIEKRLLPQSEWYAKESSKCKNRFTYLRRSEIIIAALIPFASGISASVDGFTIPGSIITGLLGVLLTIIAGMIALGHYQENWIKYRTTRENLKKEKILFDANMTPYDSNESDSFIILVHRVESLISQENSDWADYINRNDKVKTK